MATKNAAAPRNNVRNQVSKELRTKANEFLNCRQHSKNLVEIIAHLKKSTLEKLPVTSILLTCEIVFAVLLKRREMCLEVTPLKPKDDSRETKYQEWLLGSYEEVLKLILANIDHEQPMEAVQALSTSMKLLATEGKFPLEKNAIPSFPKQRLRKILVKLSSRQKSQTAVIQAFKQYGEYLDVVFHSWKLIPQLATRADFKNEKFACNYLELMNALPLTKELYENPKLLCPLEVVKFENFDYMSTRKTMNKVWDCIMQWSDGVEEPAHKQMLIVLLESVLKHLDKPILLTDFLMDSLDCGGAISLLALQGIFTLIQKNNITYPNIYEKLYSMFEPEIFHTKFKARLFYLADIFLSSTHLSESLVAAFVKRLARLGLIAPPQDVIIILHFIGNLILRHPGLKRLMCAQAAVEVSRDPFIMDERDPVKSHALESSLWEIVLLQKHAMPTVATAARFITQPLPTTEWDLSSVLEIKEDDIFDQEISKKAKQYALAFDRPRTLFLNQNDKVIQYWKLF